jgi:putative ABC transport system permease protein
VDNGMLVIRPDDIRSGAGYFNFKGKAKIMTLNTIAIQNLLRRKGKAILILVGLVLGIGTVITVISFSDAVTGDINHKLEKYGANILIVPRTENLSLSYGGISDGRHFL